MLKEYAHRRMNAIDSEIRHLVDNQDRLTDVQERRLLKLDRDHKFWQRWSA
jgi:hypothetical protein